MNGVYKAVILYLGDLLLLAIMGILLSYLYVHQLTTKLKGTKSSYIKAVLVFVLLFGIGLLQIDLRDPYGDTPLPVAGKVVVLVVSAYFSAKWWRKIAGV